ncbi:MAG: hypothetical protein IIA09_09970 [Proteobacteria bacterium]|nr:hypothetical protein [Pseudomonadota bacterium]
MKKIFAAIGLMLILQNAWAIDIRSAKVQGAATADIHGVSSRKRPV